MSSFVLRYRRLVVGLVLVAFAQGGLGVLACHAIADPSAATPAASWGSTSSIAMVADDADGHLDCREDRPCQRESPRGPAAADAVVRAWDGPRDGGPSTLPSRLDAPAAPASRVGPEPMTAAPPLHPAVLAPVAVLCVDRN